MGAIKDLLIGLIEHVHSGDFASQDELQTRILDGRGLTEEEWERAQSCEEGRTLIEAGMLQRKGTGLMTQPLTIGALADVVRASDEIAEAIQFTPNTNCYAMVEHLNSLAQGGYSSSGDDQRHRKIHQLNRAMARLCQAVREIKMAGIPTQELAQ
jgi:hypothetical protein